MEIGTITLIKANIFGPKYVCLCILLYFHIIISSLNKQNTSDKLEYIRFFKNFFKNHQTSKKITTYLIDMLKNTAQCCTP